MRDGYIYVMSCPSLPHLLKIGCSADCADRVQNMSSTSVPMPFKLEHSWKVDDMFLVEKSIHDHLYYFRVASNREFFAIAVERAIRIIDGIINEGKYKFQEVELSDSFFLTDVKSMGQFLKGERSRQSLTQEQLAGACNTGLRFISEMESGKETMQVGKFFEVIKGLGFNIVLTKRGL